MNQLNLHIEALIFCSEQSISIDEIAASLKLSFDWEPSEEEILIAIEEIKIKYSSGEFAFELIEISEGYQFLTKKDFHPSISALIQHKAKKKLSIAQMETLSIIAYKQPVTKPEIEHIRGVNCDYAMQKLLEKELVEIKGKSDGPGRAVLYTTSKNFMDYFGIRTAKDLPQLKDIHMEQNEIGQASEYMDSEDIIAVSSEEGVSISESTEVITIESEESIFQAAVLESDPVSELPQAFAEGDYSAQIPDRKTIFLQNEKTEEEDISEEEIPGFSDETDPS